MHNVWIIGASRNIGRGTAMELASQGWEVAASGRDARALESLSLTSAKTRGRILPFPVDVTDAEGVQACLGQIEEQMGPVTHVIIASQQFHASTVVPFSLEPFHNVFNTNVLGCLNCLNALIPKMVERRLGHIVILSSFTAYRGLPGWGAFGAGAAAIYNVCESLKTELDDYNVKLSLVNPGFFRPGMATESDFLAPFILNKREAAEALADALLSEKFEYAVPGRLALAFRLLKALPHKFYFRFVEKYLVNAVPEGEEEFISSEKPPLLEEGGVAEKTLLEEVLEDQQREAEPAEAAGKIGQKEESVGEKA